MAFFDSFTSALKEKWLQYYQANREWLNLHMQVAAVKTPDGGRRPPSYFIIGSLNGIEPKLAQLMLPFSRLNPDPDTLIEVIGLNFDPDIALGLDPETDLPSQGSAPSVEETEDDPFGESETGDFTAAGVAASSLVSDDPQPPAIAETPEPVAEPEPEPEPEPEVATDAALAGVTAVAQDDEEDLSILEDDETESPEDTPEAMLLDDGDSEESEDSSEDSSEASTPESPEADDALDLLGEAEADSDPQEADEELDPFAGLSEEPVDLETPIDASSDVSDDEASDDDMDLSAFADDEAAEDSSNAVSDDMDLDVFADDDSDSDDDADADADAADSDDIDLSAFAEDESDADEMDLDAFASDDDSDGSDDMDLDAFASDDDSASDDDVDLAALADEGDDDMDLSAFGDDDSATDDGDDGLDLGAFGDDEDSDSDDDDNDFDLAAFGGDDEDSGLGDLGEDDELDEAAFGALMEDDDDEEDPEISNLLSDLE